MKQFIALIATISIVACSSNSSDKKDDDVKPTVTSNPLLTDEEQKEGWKLLFDGTAIAGWHNYGGGAVGAQWQVENGAMKFAGPEKKDTIAQDIVTDDEYENFDLKLEWKIDTGGNSGILFYVKEDTAHHRPYWTGPEMQVLDNERHPDSKIIKHRAGDLYDLISCSKETVRPALEWNQVEIKAMNGKLDFWLNGENVVSTQMWDDNWNKMIANSKFKQWPGFGTSKKGRICLQDHGNTVWFRNIKIRSL